MAKFSAEYEKGVQMRGKLFGPAAIARGSVASEVAPFMSQLSNEVLFGKIWARTDKLDVRSRRLLTLAALISVRSTGELKTHMKGALRDSLTREELGEVITHLAFYLGWPTAVHAVRVARDALAESEAEGTIKPAKK